MCSVPPNSVVDTPFLEFPITTCPTHERFVTRRPGNLQAILSRPSMDAISSPSSPELSNSSPPPPTAAAASLASQRQYESDRKRRYRAEQRIHRRALKAEVDVLEHQLKWLQERQAWRMQATRLFRGMCTSMDLNRDLRGQICRHRDLVRVLSRWVQASIHPRPLAMRRCTPWLDSTLLADPVARQYGLRWLTDRVYHSAMVAHGALSSSNVDDIATVEIHTDGTDDLGAIESHFQSTVLANNGAIADCMWSLFTERRRSTVHTIEILVNDGHLLYLRVYDSLHDTMSCILLRRYDLPTRVVFARLFLRTDECFPLQPNEVRPHAFGWTIMERITDDVTLYSSRLMQFAPVTTDGELSVERIAAVFGVAEPTRLARPTILAQIQTNALRNLVNQRRQTDLLLHERLHERRLVRADDETPLGDRSKAS
ncbi:Aste57867_16784 [Aphanomyces stellatus]|uniref:Aste57867_16784 protein n=1 Tax=Aphanomyces stellatus TaxID=120398 RepID=A0A485L9D1_9STRA|nr:hypothetical protein As57867_016727 [Aphanomyces stellatus]VFT93549.1 Aste57867_16784 [Aphanomyces stellatus]